MDKPNEKILNLSIVNTILQEYISDTYKQEKICREKFIESYKTDFLIIGERKIIIEAKGIITAMREIKFPTVFSSREIEQLKSISRLIDEEHEAQYYYISLSPILRLIKIN